MAIDATAKAEREFIGDLEACNSSAKAAGFTLLVRPQEIQLHYPSGAMQKIYPQNGRIYAAPHKVPPPFLTLPDPYGLIDIINAASAAHKGNQ